METKMRYKRRKVKKHWVTVAIAATALMLGGAVSTQASADSVVSEQVASTTAEQKVDEKQLHLQVKKPLLVKRKRLKKALLTQMSQTRKR